MITIRTSRSGDESPRGVAARRIPARVCVVLLAAACVLSLVACNRQKQAAAAPIAEVSTLTVAPQSVLLTTRLPGRTAPCLIAEIRPQVNGLILKRLFTEGADVKEGQDLYQLDPAPFQAALDNAQAMLGKAEARLPSIRSRAERYKQALADKAVSEQDYQDADSMLKQAEADVLYSKASLETASIQLGYTRIVAPISGRVGKSTVTDGAIVTAYQPTPLATIQQMDPIYVDVPQSAALARLLPRAAADGQPAAEASNLNVVQLIMEGGTKYPLDGALQFRDVSVDPTTGSVVLRMVFPNPDGALLPGMFVLAIVKERVEDQAIMIPQQAVSRDPKGEALALIVDADGKVEQRKLVLARAMGDQWLVSSGLSPGERVVVEGLQKARPGSTVKVVPTAAGSKQGTEPGSTAAPAAAAK